MYWTVFSLPLEWVWDTFPCSCSPLLSWGVGCASTTVGPAINQIASLQDKGQASPRDIGYSSPVAQGERAHLDHFHQQAASLKPLYD